MLACHSLRKCYTPIPMPNLPAVYQLIVSGIFIAASTLTTFIPHQTLISPIPEGKQILRQLVGKKPTPTHIPEIIGDSLKSKKTTLSPTPKISGKTMRINLDAYLTPSPEIESANNYSDNTPANPAVSAVPTDNPGYNPPSDTPIPTSVTPRMQTAKSTISANGKTINLTMKYPYTGGPVTGSISGDCSGTLDGNYLGPEDGLISGTADVSCKDGFLSVQVSVFYDGKLLPGSTQTEIHYITSVLGQKKEGTTTLSISS